MLIEEVDKSIKPSLKSIYKILPGNVGDGIIVCWWYTWYGKYAEWIGTMVEELELLLMIDKIEMRKVAMAFMMKFYSHNVSDFTKY